MNIIETYMSAYLHLIHNLHFIIWRRGNTFIHFKICSNKKIKSIKAHGEQKFLQLRSHSRKKKNSVCLSLGFSLREHEQNARNTQWKIRIDNNWPITGLKICHLRVHWTCLSCMDIALSTWFCRMFQSDKLHLETYQYSARK